MAERITNGNFTTNLNGWTTKRTPTSNTFLQRLVDYYGVPFVMMQNFSGSASSDVSISQTVNFTDCQYLNFDYNAEDYGDSGHNIQVQVDGVTIAYIPNIWDSWGSLRIPVSFSGNHVLKFKCAHVDYDPTFQITHISMESNPLPPAPVAAFEGFPTGGDRPLTVLFTDESTNTPTSWLWNFGDGLLSAERNPTHIYNVAGVYSVVLSATNAGGTGTLTKTDYITVTEPPPPPPYVEPIWTLKIGPI